MGSSIGTLLSLFLLVQAMAFSGDLCALEIAYASLHSAATTAAHYLSVKGQVSQELKDTLLSEAKATIKVSSRAYKVGDTMTFTLYREHQPIYLSKEPIVLTVKRSLIVGYL